MDIWILTNEDRQPIAETRQRELIEHFGLVSRPWLFINSKPTWQAEVSTMRYLILEGLVGEGPWLIMQDDVRFIMPPYRVGDIGDIHLYGGYPSGTNPIELEAVEPDAFLIRDREARDRLLEAYSWDVATPEAWMPLLRTINLTWDAEPTIIYAQEVQT